MRERERERERESKKHAKTDYIARLWQLLPQWLKNIPRVVRSQWHGDFYDEFERREDMLLRRFNEQALALTRLGEMVVVLQQSNTQQTAALKRLNERLNAQEHTMAEWQKAALCNQISLANKKTGQRTIHTPWSPRKTLNLTMGHEGRLCFTPNDEPGSNPRRIFTNTMPKSGTRLLGTIFEVLGFQKPTGSQPADHYIIFGGDMAYKDMRGVDANGKFVHSASFFASLPFTVQMDLIEKNQYLPAHLVYETVIQARVQGLDKIILLVRDLRYSIVWHLREVPQISRRPIETYSSSDLCNYLKGGHDSTFMFRVAEGCAKLQNEPFAHLVRYEELVSNDRERMTPSLVAISEVTGCSVDDVFKAVRETRGDDNRNITGNRFDIGTIWTKEVEELFIAKGGDVLNEKLGYPREYIPKN